QALRQGRRDHRAGEAPRAATARHARRPRPAAAPGQGEGAARRLRLREHGHAGGARHLGRRRDGGADGVKLATVGLLGLVVAAFALYVSETEPRWYERLRYPLKCEESVFGDAENYDLEPPLLAAVIYQESKFDADAVSASGAVGLMQLLPATAQGIADRN